MEQEKLNELLKSYYFYKENKDAVALFFADSTFNNGEYRYNNVTPFQKNIEKEEAYWNAMINCNILRRDINILALYILEKVLGEERELSITSFDDGLPTSSDEFFEVEVNFEADNEENCSITLDVDNLRLIFDKKYSERMNVSWDKSLNKNYVGSEKKKGILGKEISIESLIEEWKPKAEQFLKNFTEACKIGRENTEDDINSED